MAVLTAAVWIVALGGAGIASAQEPPWTPVPGPPYPMHGQPGAPAFNSNGTLLAVPDDFGFVYMASLAADGSFTVREENVGGELYSAAFSPDGSLLAVTDISGSVSVFSVGTSGQLTPRSSFPVGQRPLSVAFGPGGNFVAVLESGFGGGVSTYPVDGGPSISHVPLGPDQSDAHNLAINSNRTLLAVASGSGRVTTISVDPAGHLSLVHSSPATSNSAFWVDFSPGGNLLATGNNRQVSLFEVQHGAATEVPNSPFGPNEPNTSVAFSPDGLFLAGANYYQSPATISLFSVGAAALTPLPQYTITTEPCGSPNGRCTPYYVLFDPNGHFLVGVYSSVFYGFSIFARTGPLQISKTAQPRVVTQGGVLRYRLTVHNPNSHPVGAATVTDNLTRVFDQATYRHDAHATIGTVTVDTSPPRLTWHGTLGAGQTAIITYSVTVHAHSTGFVTNRVEGPPGSSCPCVTETPIVPPPGPGADLSVTKTASTHSTHPGGQVLYTLSVHNHGPLDASGVTVSDPVPAGLFFHSAQPSQGSCTLTASELTCSLGGIRAGAGAMVLVEATVATDARGTITNLANVHGRQHDPHPGNNTASSNVSVTPWTGPETTANLVVAKHGPAAATQGQRFRYTITVTNHGPDSASDITLTDTAQLPLRVVSLHPSQGHCQAGPPISCALGTLHNGAHATITVTAVATSAERQVNSAVVMSPGWDPAPGTNMAQRATLIRPTAPPAFTG